jgi:hypothetical protein
MLADLLDDMAKDHYTLMFEAVFLMVPTLWIAAGVYYIMWPEKARHIGDSRTPQFMKPCMPDISVTGAKVLGCIFLIAGSLWLAAAVYSLHHAERTS